MRIGSAIAAFVMLVGTGHMASAATVIKQPSTITLVRHEYDCNYCQPGQVKPVAGILNGLSTGNSATGIVTFTFAKDHRDGPVTIAWRERPLRQRHNACAKPKQCVM